MLSNLLSNIGFPAVLGAVQSALGHAEHPVAKRASQELKSLHSVLLKHDIDPDVLSIAFKQALQQDQNVIEQVNQSIRAEILSEDKYVRRMRPTFGYIMAITWGVQMLSVAYIIVFRPDIAGDLINAMGSLSAIWGIGLSVLGVYVYKRSQDKINIFNNHRGIT